MLEVYGFRDAPRQLGHPVVANAGVDQRQVLEAHVLAKGRGEGPAHLGDHVAVEELYRLDRLACAHGLSQPSHLVGAHFAAIELEFVDGVVSRDGLREQPCLFVVEGDPAHRESVHYAVRLGKSLARLSQLLLGDEVPRQLQVGLLIARTKQVVVPPFLKSEITL